MVKLRAVLASVTLAACAQQPALQDHPLTGKIWDPHAAAFVSMDQLFQRAARARHVILGETHDNPEQHRLQRVVLEALAARGAARLLAMEQFDSEYQTAIDTARASQGDVETIADAGHFDRKGWN